MEDRRLGDDDDAAQVTAGSYYGFDSWQGYPQEREELLGAHPEEKIDDVVFIPATSTCSSPAMCVQPRERRERGGRVRRRIDHVAELRRDEPRRRRRNRDPGQRPAPEHESRDPRRVARPTTRGSTRRTRPPRLRGRRAPPRAARLYAQARRDDQAALAKTLTNKGYTYHVRRGQKSIKGVNGPRRMNRRPRLELRGSSATPEEAAAVMAAVEQCLRDTTPPPAPRARRRVRGSAPHGWRESTASSARQIDRKYLDSDTDLVIWGWSHRPRRVARGRSRTLRSGGRPRPRHPDPAARVRRLRQRGREVPRR